MDTGGQVVHLILNFNQDTVCPFCGGLAKSQTVSDNPYNYNFDHFVGTQCSPGKPFTVGSLWWKKRCNIGGYHNHYRCGLCNTLWIVPRKDVPINPVGHL